jgi:hypothetical protein
MNEHRQPLKTEAGFFDNDLLFYGIQPYFAAVKTFIAAHP